jgi:hypothetical protein
MGSSDPVRATVRDEIWFLVVVGSRSSGFTSGRNLVSCRRRIPQLWLHVGSGDVFLKWRLFVAGSEIISKDA